MHHQCVVDVEFGRLDAPVLHDRRRRDRDLVDARRRVGEPDVLGRVEVVGDAKRRADVADVEAVVAPPSGAADQLRDLEVDAIDAVDRRQRNGSGIGIGHRRPESRRARTDPDKVRPRLALLQRRVLVDHQQVVAVVVDAAQIGKAPALVRAREVGRRTAEGVTGGGVDQQTLGRGHVRFVLEAKRGDRWLRQRIVEQSVGEHLLQDANVATDDRRCRRRAAEARVIVGGRVASSARQVPAQHAFVVGADLGLDTSVAGGTDARRRPDIVCRVGVVEVPNAADRDHVLGPSLRPRVLRNGRASSIALALRQDEVKREQRVIESRTGRGVVERQRATPTRSLLHGAPRASRIATTLDHREARQAAPRVDARLDDLCVRDHAAGGGVARTVAANDHRRAMTVLVRAVKPDEHWIGPVGMRLIEAFADLGANADAGVARHRLDVVATALDARVVHVELDAVRGIDPEHGVERHNARELSRQQRRDQED